MIAARHARWCLDEVTRIRELLAGHGRDRGGRPPRRAVAQPARRRRLGVRRRATAGWRERSSRPVATEVYLRSRSEIGDWAERILAITPPDDEELIVFGLTWAARRYMRNLDREGYERLVGRYGEPDHPMIRYAAAFLYDDYAAMAESARRSRSPSCAGEASTTSPTSTSWSRWG